MLKFGLIVVVLICFVVLAGLLYLSFKMLRQTQQQQKLEQKSTEKNYELHPKLKEKSK